MNGQQILIPVNAAAFWKRMRVVVRDVISEQLLRPHADGAAADVLKLSKAKDVCQLFQLSKPAIYGWVRPGKLQSVKIELIIISSSI